VGKIATKARRRRLEYQARLGRTVTAREVAETIGVTEATLSRIEQGKTERIDFETLRKLCEFYGVGVGEILEYDPSIQIPELEAA
jgi:DNA-binding Xre family transcriptional regulator